MGMSGIAARHRSANSSGNGRPTISTPSRDADIVGDAKIVGLGLTFDDGLLLPAASDILANDVSTETRIAAGITLRIPIMSAAMDTVTEGRMAIALAREGGIGVIHRNLPIADQVAEVDKVKRSESGMIVEPVTLSPEAPVHEALAVME